MQSTHDIKEQPRKKQIAFDLGETELEKFYPRPVNIRGHRYYKKAWTDISKFMLENGFEHRQYSVYNSKMEMKEMEVYALARVMAKRMPWLRKCLKVIDMTDIGENQSLMPYMLGLEDDYGEGKAG